MDSSDSDTDSVRTEASIEVEDFSPPSSPIDPPSSPNDEVEDFSPPESPDQGAGAGGAAGPQPYRFEPLASEAAEPEDEDGALEGEALPADHRMGDTDW